jgi:hypothetical protein
MGKSTENIHAHHPFVGWVIEQTASCRLPYATTYNFFCQVVCSYTSIRNMNFGGIFFRKNHRKIVKKDTVLVVFTIPLYSCFAIFRIEVRIVHLL